MADRNMSILKMLQTAAVVCAVQLVFHGLGANFTQAQQATFGWAMSLGPIAHPSIAADSAGNLFLGYQSADGTSWNIRKADRNGTILWSKTLGARTSIAALTTDANGACYAVGYAPSGAFSSATVTPQGSGSVFMAKYSAAGDLLWIRLDGKSQNAFGTAIKVDAAGNLYLSGYYVLSANFTGVDLPVTPSDSDPSMFLVKYGPDGSLRWARSSPVVGPLVGGSSGSTLAVNPSGNVFLAVSALSTPGSLNDSNSVDFGGATASTPASFGAKYGSDGDLRWVVPIEGAGAAGIALDQEGNSLVLSTGRGQFAVTKFSPDGAPLWQQAYAVPYLIADDLAVDNAGNCLIAARYSYEGGPATFGTNTFTTTGESELAILEFSPAGDLRWAISSIGVGTAQYHSPNPSTSDIEDSRLAMAPDGTCFVVASFKGTIQFSATTLAGPGYNAPAAIMLGTIVDPATVATTTPSLQIAPSSRGVLLTWTSTAAGFILESATSLASTGVWFPVSVSPTANGVLNSVQLEAPSTPTFYRLKKP
jgi:hypothetical protein